MANGCKGPNTPGEPILIALADEGWRKACEDDPHLLDGLNVRPGHLTCYSVGKAQGIDVLSPRQALGE